MPKIFTIFTHHCNTNSGSELIHIYSWNYECRSYSNMMQTTLCHGGISSLMTRTQLVRCQWAIIKKSKSLCKEQMFVTMHQKPEFGLQTCSTLKSTSLSISGSFLVQFPRGLLNSVEINVCYVSRVLLERISISNMHDHQDNQFSHGLPQFCHMVSLLCLVVMGCKCVWTWIHAFYPILFLKNIPTM